MNASHWSVAALVAVTLVAFLQPQVFEGAAHSLGVERCEHRHLSQLENDAELARER